MLVLRWLAAAVAVVLLVCSALTLIRTRRPVVAVEALQALVAAQPDRVIEPRLSLLRVYRPLARSRGQATHPLGLQIRVAADRVVMTAPEAAKYRSARATAYLVAGDTTSAVRELSLAGESSPDVAADLAAALLIESDRTGDIEIAIDALDAADDAVRLDPAFPPALFNRALALERIGLLSEAREEWRHYTRVDPSTPWTTEAAAAGDRLLVESDAAAWRRARQTLAAAVHSDSAETVRSIVARFPQLVRIYGEGVYLSDWAEGDDVALATARAIGRELYRLNSESLLKDAVAAIDAAILDGDQSRVSTLTKAHRLYREGRLAFRDKDLGTADAKLDASERAFEAGGSPMALVARYYRAAVLYEQTRIDDAQAILDELAASKPERRGYLALAGQIGWERGLCRMVRASFSDAKGIFVASRQILKKLGEHELTATFDLHLAQIAEYIGDASEGWTYRRPAFVVLSRNDNDYRVAVNLAAAASSRVIRRDWRRAGTLARVAAAMAVRLKDPQLAANALLMSSVAATERDRLGEAALALGSADVWIRSIANARTRRRVEAERALASAALLRNTDPGGAVAEASRAIDFYERSVFRIFLPRAYLERARAHRAAGDTRWAAADIARGIDIAEWQRENVADLEQRAMLFASSNALFVEGAELSLSIGDWRGALTFVERGRARAILDAFGGDSRARQSMRVDEVQRALSIDAAIVSYALLSGRLAAFVIRSGGVTVAETSFDIEHVRNALKSLESQRRHDDTAAAIAAAELYELFVAPIETDLHGAKTVAIVGDSALERIPLNVLMNARTNRRGVEDFTFIESPSASVAIDCSRRQASLSSSPMLVGANVFDEQSFPSAKPLPGIAGELRSIAEIWAGASTVVGARVTPTSFQRLALSAEFIHFAGHGLDDMARPSEAKLLLAPDGRDHGAITAGEIAKLDLHQTRLVVLNSCRTAASSRRTDGVVNIATAFVIAGVPTVIAATSEVDDASAAEFAIRLHRQLRAGVPPELALRNVIREDLPPLSQMADGSLRFRAFTAIGGAKSLIGQADQPDHHGTKGASDDQAR